MASVTTFLEVACFNMQSIEAACLAGADRIEFCADRASGGISPDLKILRDLTYLHSRYGTSIYIMIRPRGGDFVYTYQEFRWMKAMTSLMVFKELAEGLVFGILNAHGYVDLERNKELIRLAEPFPCTFHRAFDQVNDLDDALEDVIACGFKTILTSGGATDAVSGAEVLERLVKKAEGRIMIMPGGGVRSSNIQKLKETTNAQWYHSSAIVTDGDDADKDEVHRMKQAISLK